jgi:hypothetical protein
MRYLQIAAMALALPACTGCFDTKPEATPEPTPTAVTPPTPTPPPTAAPNPTPRTPTEEEIKAAVAARNQEPHVVSAFAPHQAIIGGQKVTIHPPRPMRLPGGPRPAPATPAPAPQLAPGPAPAPAPNH